MTAVVLAMLAVVLPAADDRNDFEKFARRIIRGGGGSVRSSHQMQQTAAAYGVASKTLARPTGPDPRKSGAASKGRKDSGSYGSVRQSEGQAELTPRKVTPKPAGTGAPVGIGTTAATVSDAITIRVGKTSYTFATETGAWYLRRMRAGSVHYEAVPAPIGAIVCRLPSVERLEAREVGGTTYYVWAGAFYKAAPPRDGQTCYEVVSFPGG